MVENSSSNCGISKSKAIQPWYCILNCSYERVWCLPYWANAPTWWSFSRQLPDFRQWHAHVVHLVVSNHTKHCSALVWLMYLNIFFNDQFMSKENIAFLPKIKKNYSRKTQSCQGKGTSLLIRETMENMLILIICELLKHLTRSEMRLSSVFPKGWCKDILVSLCDSGIWHLHFQNVEIYSQRDDAWPQNLMQHMSKNSPNEKNF